MSDATDRKYIVSASGKKSRPVSRRVILQMCGAGRIAPDATVAAVGSTLHKPILVFLGETADADHTPPDDDLMFSSSEPTAASSSGRGRFALLVICVMLIIGAINGVFIYQLAQQVGRQHQDVQDQMALLQQNIEQLTKAQEQLQANQVAVKPKPAEDPVAQFLKGRPQNEQILIGQIFGQLQDYAAAADALAREGGAANDPAREAADEAIERLTSRLQNDFGIRLQDAITPEERTPEQSSQSSYPQ